jgi:hypothetical protein
MQNVAVLDLIGLALDAELARLFRPGLAVAGDIVVIGYSLGADESLFEIAMDDPGGARGQPAGLDQARASFGPTVK